MYYRYLHYFLSEGSGDSTESFNGEDGEGGTTIPKLTINIGGEKGTTVGEEEENDPTEKYPDADEEKEERIDELKGYDAGRLGPDLESEEEERGDGAPTSANTGEQEMSSNYPDPAFSEIGVWDNKGGEAEARQIDLGNIMDKLKEVYDMIHNVIKKWTNSDTTEEPSSYDTTPASGTTEVNTEMGNGDGDEPSSDTSAAPTTYKENQDEADTGKKKRRKRQKKKRRHRRVRRIRRRQ